mgnify:FL=1
MRAFSIERDSCLKYRECLIKPTASFLISQIKKLNFIYKVQLFYSKPLYFLLIALGCLA